MYKEEYKNVDKGIQTSVIKKVQSTKIGFSQKWFLIYETRRCVALFSSSLITSLNLYNLFIQQYLIQCLFIPGLPCARHSSNYLKISQ